MAIRRSGGFAVYRTHDARRSVVGVLSKPVFEALVTDGLVAEKEGRFVWIGQAADAARASKSGAVGLVRVASRRSRSSLQKALSVSRDEREELRLLKAARRFVKDLAATMRGPAVTMNWDLVPRGNSGQRSSMAPGQSIESMRARKSIGALKQGLDAGQYELLSEALCSDKSQSQLAIDFGLSAKTLPKALNRALVDLAHAYDTYVPRAD